MCLLMAVVCVSFWLWYVSPFGCGHFRLFRVFRNKRLLICFLKVLLPLILYLLDICRILLRFIVLRLFPPCKNGIPPPFNAVAFTAAIPDLNELDKTFTLPDDKLVVFENNGCPLFILLTFAVVVIYIYKYIKGTAPPL